LDAETQNWAALDRDVYSSAIKPGRNRRAMEGKKRVIIDTDPGIDDAAALLMALGSRELQVDAITTVFGNASVEKCTTNALRILEAAKRPEIPVYQGVGRTFNFYEPEFAGHIHGDDGLGQCGLPMPGLKPQEKNAVLEIIERVLASPGEVTLVCLGRLTNLALAIGVEPRIARAIREVIVMGGAINVPGNATPAASANFWGDPEATDVSYRSGAKIVQIGLDVCNRVEISSAQQQRVWLADTSASRFMKTITPFIQQAYNSRGLLRDRGGARYNDVLAMAYAIDSSLFECRDLYVRIETQGALTRGQTVSDQEGLYGMAPNVTVAFDVDAPRTAELWAERVSGLKP
jgi:inosine-uridine nucleoside N-ribohydrolase